METINVSRAERHRHHHPRPAGEEERDERRDVGRAARDVPRDRRQRRRPGGGHHRGERRVLLGRRPHRLAAAAPTHQLAAMRHVGDVAWRCTACPSPSSPRCAVSPWAPGCNLALGCDLVVAGDTARFSQIFARRGLSASTSAARGCCPAGSGLHQAKELAFFADIIDAAEAERIGLVNRVVRRRRARRVRRRLGRAAGRRPAHRARPDQADARTTR